MKATDGHMSRVLEEIIEGKTVPSFMNTKKERLPVKFSLVPLLLANRDISTEARQALAENRLEDAAQLLMQEHGLSCTEASHLLDVSASDED